jgi:hypothetical protein
MKFETFTQKREASETIEKLHGKRLGNKLNYEEVMAVNEVFDEGEVVKFKKRRSINLTKYEIFYCLIALIVIALLVAGLIITGIKLWR